MSRPHYAAIANWSAHVNRHAVSAQMRDWLTNRESLTARLVACCVQFRVQLLHQQVSRCLTDEFAVIGLSRPTKVVERDVLLWCDDSAVVYAHTVLPLAANASHWPLFASLGNKSLGTTLFNDPLVTRGALHFSQLATTHPLMRRIGELKLPGVTATSLYARRSVFTRHGSSLLVTEVFLPSIRSLDANLLKNSQ